VVRGRSGHLIKMRRMSDNSQRTTDTPTSTGRVPGKPALEGLEARWSARWEADKTYAFRRPEVDATDTDSIAAARAEVFSIDTPRPRCRARCTSATSSATPTPISSPATSGCGASVFFYPMGWDDNGLPTERRVQNYLRRPLRSVDALRPALQPPRPNRTRDDRCRSAVAISSSCVTH